MKDTSNNQYVAENISQEQSDDTQRKGGQSRIPRVDTTQTDQNSGYQPESGDTTDDFSNRSSEGIQEEADRGSNY